MITEDANIPQEGNPQLARMHANCPISFPVAGENALSADTCLDAKDEDTRLTKKAVNKYKYPEFANFAGERYLEEILQHICPFALYRTWHNLVARQAPGNDAYTGVGRAARIAGRSERKIYLDLEELVARGLMRMYHDRRVILLPDGTHRMQMVTIKDFEPLYDLAHEYHVWSMLDPDYIAPLREYAPAIIAQPALFQKLIRFECYRKILLCKKPGPKSQPRQRWYNQSLETLLNQAQQVAIEDVKDAHSDNTTVDGPNLKEQLETQLEKVSLYGTYSTENSDGLGGPNSSKPLKKGTEAQATIRKANEQHPEQLLPEIQNQTHPSRIPNHLTTPPRSGAAPESAKTIQGYTEEELKLDMQKRGAAAAGIPAEHQRKLSGGQDNAEQELQRRREAEQQDDGSQEERSRRVLSPHIEDMARAYAQRYDDPALIKSDVTRVAKLYFTASQVLQYFDDQMFVTLWDQARQAANHLRGCEHTNLTGRRNVMPYFFSCLENAFGMSLEELVYMRTELCLYEDVSVFQVIEHLQKEYQQKKEEQHIDLEYRAWLCGLLDTLERRQKPKDRSRVPTERSV